MKSYQTRICEGLLCALVFCAVLFPAFFSAAEETGYTYIAPKLSSSADPYDPEHPELLSPDQLYAKSAILIEAKTGKVIFEKDADAHRFPASTTKIMTIYLGLLYGDPAATVYLTEEDKYGMGEGDADMDLEVGESINFRDLMYGTFIRSANEGASLIARTVSGSVYSFADLMNQMAISIGCTDTNFVNANGLHDEAHYTTARDMALIARTAMQNDDFRDIAKTYTYSLPKSNLHRSRVLTHSSRMFFNPSLEENEYYYPDAIGIKTGYTSAAGYCFVGAAERNGVELISVVFYTTESGRWTDTKKLMDYGFSQYISIKPSELYAKNPVTIITTGYAMNDEGYGRLELYAKPVSGAVEMPIITTQSDLNKMARNLRQTVTIEYSRDFAAPIEMGESLGTMTYYPEDGGSPVLYDLVASRSIAERENKPLSLEEIEAEVQNDPNPFPPITIELLINLLVPLVIIFLLIRFLIQRLNTKQRFKKAGIPKPSGREFR